MHGSSSTHITGHRVPIVSTAMVSIGWNKVGLHREGEEEGIVCYSREMLSREESTQERTYDSIVIMYLPRLVSIRMCHPGLHGSV
jgi:hypothetical protein